MEEKKRKSSRSFELEKGGKRSFDLQKTSARKFDLEKDSDEVSLEELKKDLLADGKIDAEEVNKLREVLFADGKIDQEEADFLFEINDAVSGRSNDSSWKAFFVEAISDYLLNDEKSPGVIDEDEGKWLEAKINNDGKLDTVERALVASLRRKSKSMPKSLSTVLSQVASRFNLKKDEVPTAEAVAAMAALAATKAKASRFSLEKENNDTANINIEELKKEILYDGKIDREEVETLRKALYADGKIDQEEADFLFELNDAVSGKKNDPAWNQFFVQAISDYLLNDEKSPGVIDEEEGKWLVEKIGADGQVDGLEKQLLDNLKKNAKKVPAAVTALITGSIAAKAISTENVDLKQLKTELIADGKIDKEEVERLRKTLYADGKIDQEEADFLFELNDAVSGKKNDPAWNQFFVQAISDYLLNDEKSPGVIDEEEGKWLVEKIGADGQVDGLEKQLLDNLKKNAKKVPAAVTALITGSIAAKAISTENVDLKQLKTELIADGKIDKEEVERLRKTLYADGKIDQEEADFLFELNDAVSGKKNDPAWNQFFVQAISDYLLNDEKSPGVIDEEEGKWLVEKIGADGQVDGLEKQLLDNLKKNAKKVPASLTALLRGSTYSKASSVSSGESTPQNSEDSKSKKWIWILLAFVIVAAIAYFCMKSCNSSKEEHSTEQMINSDKSESDKQATSKDSTYNTANKKSSVVDGENSDTGNSPASNVTGNTDNTSSSEVVSSPQNTVSKSETGGSKTSSSNRPSTGNQNSTAVQPMTNHSQQVVVNGSTEEAALDVIRGIYGAGLERKQKLGDRYKEIQSIVNEMFRNGQVH